MFFLNFQGLSSDGNNKKVLPSYYQSVIEYKEGSYSSSDFCPEMVVINFDRKKGLVTVRAPQGNPVPLFYGWTQSGNLVISDSVPGVLSSLPLCASASPDRVGIIESFLFDAPLSKRTLYSDVKKLRSGEEITFKLVDASYESKWFWLPALQSGNFLSEEFLISEAKRHIKNLMDRVSLAEDRFVLPLTGGLDSRLFAAQSVLDRGKNPVSYTFRRGWSIETLYAKKVAKVLNIDHVIIDLDIECYKEFAMQVVKNTGGMISGMHTHGIYACEHKLGKEYVGMPRLFGHFGGPFAGENTASLEFSGQVNDPASIYNHFSKSIYPNLVLEYADEIIEDIRDIYHAFNQSGSKSSTFYDFWRIMERQSALLSGIFNYHRSFHHVNVVEPYLNKEALDFFFSLPQQYRYDRALFKKACRGLYPDVFSLPSMHFESSSFMGILERGFELGESVADKIKPSQEWFLSPFKFEQHEKNLMNHLRKDIEEGMNAVSDLFGVEPKNPEFPVWRKSTIKEYYRLAAVGYLFS